MKIISAYYEHTKIGFGKVKLKWTVEHGRVTSAYVTVKDVIDREWTWHNPNPIPFIEFELKRFEEWVLNRFLDDVTVQD